MVCYVLEKLCDERSNERGFSDISASIIGFNALTASSAFGMSVSFSMQRSDSPLQTSGDNKVAQVAGCCSRNLWIMSYELFHLVETSVYMILFN